MQRCPFLRKNARIKLCFFCARIFSAVRWGGDSSKSLCVGHCDFCLDDGCIFKGALCWKKIVSISSLCSLGPWASMGPLGRANGPVSPYGPSWAAYGPHGPMWAFLLSVWAHGPTWCLFRPVAHIGSWSLSSQPASLTVSQPASQPYRQPASQPATFSQPASQPYRQPTSQPATVSQPASQPYRQPATCLYQPASQPNPQTHTPPPCLPGCLVHRGELFLTLTFG
jgi:hypothetical protein